MAKSAKQIENFRLYVIGGAPRQGSAKGRRTTQRRGSFGGRRAEPAPF